MIVTKHSCQNIQASVHNLLVAKYPWQQIILLTGQYEMKIVSLLLWQNTSQKVCDKFHSYHSERVKWNFELNYLRYPSCLKNFKLSAMSLNLTVPMILWIFHYYDLTTRGSHCLLSCQNFPGQGTRGTPDNVNTGNSHTQIKYYLKTRETIVNMSIANISKCVEFSHQHTSEYLENSDKIGASWKLNKASS